MGNNDRYIKAKTKLFDMRNSVRALVDGYQRNPNASERDKNDALVLFSRFREEYRIEMQVLDRKRERMDAEVYERHGVPFPPRVQCK